MEYRIQYAIAWLNAAAGVIGGALAGANLALHPSWLSSDVAATGGVAVVISLGLAQILPPLQRTPASREAKYIAAIRGVLPDDLAVKHPSASISASEAAGTIPR